MVIACGNGDHSGEFRHTGIDTFTLLEREEGWRIVSIAFSMEPEGGPESPLPPPDSTSR